MSLKSTSWKLLRKAASVASGIRFVALLVTAVVFPIAECIFVNLFTSAEEGKKWFPLAILIVIGIVHLIISGLILLGELFNPLSKLIDNLEKEEKIDSLESELHRRSESYKMIRSAIDTLNLQTCDIDPTAEDVVETGLSPIMQKVTCSISTTLGVTSNCFSLEVYFYESYLQPFKEFDGVLRQDYFFSPHVIHQELGLDLETRSPAYWGLERRIPGTCTIEEDKERFFENGLPAKDLYFYRLATVPINEVCSPEIIGILVLTSQQRNSFAEDVLDVMGFIASMLSQYIASHNRCVYEYLESQKKAQAARKRKERAEQKKKAETEDEAVEEDMVDEEGATQVFYATIVDSTGRHPTRSIQLQQQEDHWAAEGFALYQDKAVIEGKEYPIEWTDPLSITLDHESIQVTFTE